MRRKAIGLLLAILFLAAVFPVSFADASCITVSPSAPANAQINVGVAYTLDLSTVFSDTEGHNLTYTLDQDYGALTYIKEDGVFVFSGRTAGIYTPTIIAGCSGGTAAYTITITVNPAQDGDESQYNYDETPAGSVSVYVTISNDGIPIMGNDGESTALVHLEVTVPYFDLSIYGLEDFYRYATDGGSGPYVHYDAIIERPTALHLYIYMLERYYLGLPEEDCLQGYVDLAGYSGNTYISYMDGQPAYESGNYRPLLITGSPTSMYMYNFWGHDENLMYYRNHVYPLMSAGWGSTADYMLLSNGDTIDLAMFSNWSFWTYGAFTRFDKDDYAVQTGSMLNFTTQKYDTQSVADGGSESFEPIAGLNVAVYDEEWNKLADIDAITDGSSFAYSFADPGIYYLLGVDPNGNTDDACYAPATAKVVVTGAYGDVDGNGDITAADALLVYRVINASAELTETQQAAADVNGDGEITAADALLIYRYVNGAIASFPR